jgi:hypothetical protein
MCQAASAPPGTGRLVRPMQSTSDSKRFASVTPSEVFGWFQNRAVNAELLGGFVDLLNLHLIIQQAPRKSTLPSPAAVIGAAWALRGDLDRLETVLGVEFWAPMGAPSLEMKRLHAALIELDGFLRPAAKMRKHAIWHEHAPWYAAAIADILQQAGQARPSMVNAKGPVAAVGAKAVARVWRVPISAGRFARVVRLQRDPANQRLEKLPAGRKAIERGLRN